MQRSCARNDARHGCVCPRQVFIIGLLTAAACVNGAYSSFDPLGSTGTYPIWITSQRAITGYYGDASGITHGFILSDGQYTTVDYPGGAYTAVGGMNPSGEKRNRRLVLYR